MSEIAKAKVCWVKNEGESHRVLRFGPRYITVARFEEEKEKYPHEAWSLVVEFSEPPDESGCVVANVRFLAPEAPAELLHSGSAFDLFEGNYHIATGKVL